MPSDYLFDAYLFLDFILFQHPSIFTAPSLGTVDDEAPLAKGHARQSSRHDDHFLSVKDIRPQIDAAPLKVIVNEARMLAQFDDRLCDEIPRIVFDLFGKQ